ncbi:hypothetical protein ABT072_47450, partial [Streptomyces sp. NPDC002589]|uniref:hypothetical protein n=1 Tax=Streptomyces sp. NPDC002589 TaxID=3154420 RepID=UPI00332452F3
MTVGAANIKNCDWPGRASRERVDKEGAGVPPLGSIPAVAGLGARVVTGEVGGLDQCQYGSMPGSPVNAAGVECLVDWGHLTPSALACGSDVVAIIHPASLRRAQGDPRGITRYTSISFRLTVPRSGSR